MIPLINVPHTNSMVPQAIREYPEGSKMTSCLDKLGGALAAATCILIVNENGASRLVLFLIL